MLYLFFLIRFETSCLANIKTHKEFTHKNNQIITEYVRIEILENKMSLIASGLT